MTPGWEVVTCRPFAANAERSWSWVRAGEAASSSVISVAGATDWRTGTDAHAAREMASDTGRSEWRCGMMISAKGERIDNAEKAGHSPVSALNAPCLTPYPPTPPCRPHELPHRRAPARTHHRAIRGASLLAVLDGPPPCARRA